MDRRRHADDGTLTTLDTLQLRTDSHAHSGCRGRTGRLYFAALARQLDPSADITVWERNAADDTFGFGVVFSDETLGGIEHADPAIHRAMAREFARWDDIDIHFKGTVITSGGHGFAAMSRRRLLQILQERCAELGITVRFHTEAPAPDVLSAEYDLVVGSDGVNSTTRARYAEFFRPQLDVRNCKFMWLGTDLVFDAFKFYIVDTPYGVMQIHGYPFDATGSTFIVEMNDAVWQRAGFARHAARPFTPGESDDAGIALDSNVIQRHPRWARSACQQLAVDQLHHGAQRRVVARQRRASR